MLELPARGYHSGSWDMARKVISHPLWQLPANYLGNTPLAVDSFAQTAEQGLIQGTRERSC
jgi:hypothetical protein